MTVEMTYLLLDEEAKRVAYIADSIGHRTGRTVDVRSVAATVLFEKYDGNVTNKEISYAAEKARDIISAAEMKEDRVREPEDS